MTLNPGLVAAYRTTRERLARKGLHNPAVKCLEMARADLERAGHDRFRYYPLAGLASYQNAPNDRGGRWIERPDLAGLRFVGFADKLANIGHTGWFTHPGGDPAEVYRAAVYQLPARGGRAVYVEAYLHGEDTRAGFRDVSTMATDESQMPAVVYLNCRHVGQVGGDEYQTSRDSNDSAVRDAARGADSEAEIMAERERDYQESYDYGRQAADAIEEAKAERESARELLKALRDTRNAAGLVQSPKLCDVIRATIRGHLRDARRAYRKAAKLWEEHGQPVSWRPDLADAFAEAAGATSYWESRK